MAEIRHDTHRTAPKRDDMNAILRKIAIVSAALTLPLAGVLTAPPARAADASIYGKNLVLNGDAEAGPGAPSSDKIVAPVDWSTTGQFTAVQYGASGGFPDATSPGPQDRGKNLFEGGNVALSTAAQTIALDPAAAGIAAGNVHYTFSAWIGGYGTQSDNATVSVTFKSASGASLGTATLGPVTPAQRKNQTASIAATHSDLVPKGTVSALIIITITRVEGTYNDGSVDDVSLVLTKA
jgi:hypothetical protein